MLTLVADVAAAYFELRDFDRRLEIARRTIESRREYVQLAKDRFEGGITPELDLRQAEAELHRVEAVVFDLERLIALKENELSVLLGRNPGTDPARPDRSTSRSCRPPCPPGCPPSCSSAAPTSARPSRTLAAATANIGEAKALLFPRIALTGSFGFASTEFDDALRGSEQVLEHHRQPAAADLQRRQEQAPRRDHRVAAAPDALRLRAHDPAGLPRDRGRARGLPQDRRAARGAGRRAWRPSARCSSWPRLRYRGGVAAYLEVLDAQRSLFEAELDEAQTIGSNLVSLVRLYKALGGGWPTGLPLHDGEAEGGASTQNP